VLPSFFLSPLLYSILYLFTCVLPFTSLLELPTVICNLALTIGKVMTGLGKHCPLLPIFDVIIVLFVICIGVHIGYAVALLAEALQYKPEGRGFDSRWCHWNF